MPERKEIPNSCWTCDKSTYCNAHYGEGACKYKIAINEMEQTALRKCKKEVESNEQ